MLPSPDLSIAPRSTINAQIAIAGEIAAAEGSDIDKKIAANIQTDLRCDCDGGHGSRAACQG